MMAFVMHKSECGNTITASRSKDKDCLEVEIKRDNFVDSIDVPISWFQGFVAKYHNKFPGIHYTTDLGTEGFNVKMYPGNAVDFSVTINNEKHCDIVNFSMENLGKFAESCLKLHRSL